MNIEIKQLNKRDFNTARKFAIEGMHLNWYTNNNFELYIYSKYFWYLEVSRATRALGAYIGDKLVGVLLVDIDNQPKVFNSIGYRLFIKFSSFIINLLYKNASNTYDNANKEILEKFKKNNETDGELNFFAVDPTIKGKGIGTLLLKELEKKEKGKQIYLYTDTGSTYQFYLHRGFIESGRKDVQIKIGNREVPLTCYLFSKTL